MITQPKSVLITAAAGGIGSALARAYAAPGVRLVLGDIDAPGLEAVTTACQNLGAEVDGALVDVTDRQSMATWIEKADPLDLVICLAGISRGSIRRVPTMEEVREVFDVNLNGMLNTIEPVLPLMKKRRRGQIALMSSLAGVHGFPVSPSYCATKAAIRVYAEGLRARLARENIWVAVIIPAFIKSPLTDQNSYRMPFLISAERAAHLIKRGLARNKARLCFPQPYPVLAYLFSLLPPSLVNRLITLK